MSTVACVCVLLCFIDPRVRKIRNEVSSCPAIFCRTLCLHYVAGSPGSPLPHLVDRYRDIVGSSVCVCSCSNFVADHNDSKSRDDTDINVH